MDRRSFAVSLRLMGIACIAAALVAWAAPAGAADAAAGREKARVTQDETGRKLSHPAGLAIDPKDRILYVVNSGSSSISRIRLPPAPGTADSRVGVGAHKGEAR